MPFFTRIFPPPGVENGGKTAIISLFASACGESRKFPSGKKMRPLRASRTSGRIMRPETGRAWEVGSRRAHARADAVCRRKDAACPPIPTFHPIRPIPRMFPLTKRPCLAVTFTWGGSSPRPIDEELKDSYLTYSMSVIVSRALPDVRDGLKPSQRRILVAMSRPGPHAGVFHVEVRGHRRRDDEALPSARRHGHLSDLGPHGPGLGLPATRSSTSRATSARSPGFPPRPCVIPRPACPPSLR